MRLRCAFVTSCLGMALLWFLTWAGCAGARSDRVAETPTGQPPANPQPGATPSDSEQVSPEDLEFPEPPGLKLDPVDETAPPPLQAGPSKPVASDSSSPVPDLTEQIPLLPPPLEPAGRDGLVELNDRNDVVDKFDMPTRMENERFVYSKHKSFPYFEQVVFFFDGKGKLTKVDLFPSTAITRKQVIDRYGGVFNIKISGGYEILTYRRIHLAFFLLSSSDTVYVIRLRK